MPFDFSSPSNSAGSEHSTGDLSDSPLESEDDVDSIDPPSEGDGDSSSSSTSSSSSSSRGLNLFATNESDQPLEDSDYPIKGVGEFQGCNSSSSATSSFPRVNSFSACKTSTNIGLVAVSSLAPGVEALPYTEDESELARRRSAGVYIFATSLGDHYASPVRTARIQAVDGLFGEDCDDGIDVRVDEDIHADTNMNFVWSLDGDFAGRKFHIGARTGTNVWRLKVADGGDAITAADIDSCFHFVAYCPKTYDGPDSLNSISPLPQIEIDGLAVPTINPQIASNHLGSTEVNPYVYVVAEAPVNNVYQLFFYAFQMGAETSDFAVYGWKQLTFDGENRNSKISVDRVGNLHIVWESSRCRPDQICYGMLGPSSRAFINETFISAVDKQCQSVKVDNDVPARLSTPLVDVSFPSSLDLRERDEYGAPYGNFWSEIEASGGAVSVIDDGTITVAGNPASQKFAAYATLQRDEIDVEFDGYFSQLSYQLGFDLIPTAGAVTEYSDADVADLYAIFKQSFDPRPENGGINQYYKSGKIYTMAEPRWIYENIIPIAGSFRIPSTSTVPQVALRHYMLAIVPEKVRFIATCIDGTVVEEERYTGKYKLALVLETSANISDQRLTRQGHHWVRLIGERLLLGEKHNFKLAVHYSKLRDEDVLQRQLKDTLEAPEQSVRFSGNIIITVDDEVQAAETFVPDFSDDYHAFEIAVGCPIVAEYRSPNIMAFDGSINDNLAVNLAFTRITVGPHSVVANPYLTNFGPSDRYVAKMCVKTDVDNLESLTAAEETLQTNDDYFLNFGLQKTKVKLGQVPITFEGRNSNPSITIDICNKPHIAYQSLRDSKWNIYYTGVVDPGLPFRFDTQITNSDSNSLMPSIGVDNLGRRLIAWHDDRNGRYQIFAARSVSNLLCDAGQCTRDRLADDLGFDPVYNYNFNGEYIEDPYYANVCQLHFNFQNTSDIAHNYHFRANFYLDSNFTSLAKYIDSRYDIANWSVRRDGENYEPLAYDGVSIAPDERVDIIYNVSASDELSDEVYYVQIESDNSDVVESLLHTITFFCPVEQLPKCSVPCIYTNDTVSQKMVHFRATFYRDEDMLEPVLSVDSSSSQNKWLAGGRIAFPTAGLTVNSGETINATFNPEFLSLKDSQLQQQSTVDSLLCGTKYWVVIESKISGVYTEIESFALLCNCNAVQSEVWRTDNYSTQWFCSGQGSQDIQITQTTDNALFPSVSGSLDGMIYIAWEDHRFTNASTTVGPYAYWTAWDAENDIFYSSAQGFRDREAGSVGSFRPIMLVSNMLYPTVVWQSDTKVYNKTCSLYAFPTIDEQIADAALPTVSLIDETLLEDSDDCLSIKVAKESIVREYHASHDTPIAMVEDCQVLFEISGPPGIYAVRLKNENDTEWSPWLSVRPRYFSSSSSSSTIPNLQSQFEGIFIEDDRFIIPWIMSGGSGAKTVSCQIITHKGMTPVFATDVLARYTELHHTIEFFRDAAFAVPASLYNGYPVVSTKALEIDAQNLTTIEKPVTENATIYVRVVFTDPDRLDRVLATNEIDRFRSLGTDLTFDVVTQGKVQSRIGLEAVSPGDSVVRGTYKGSFTVSKSDGFDNQDGLAVIVINIPTPCQATPSSSSVCGDPRTTDDVKADRLASVIATQVGMERFRLKYNADILCTFLGRACEDGTDPLTDGPIDDTSEQQPPYYGPVECDILTWRSPRRGEKYFYIDGGDANADDWTVYSEQLVLDFSDNRIDYLKFTVADLDDVLVMIKPGDTISYAESSVTLSSSSACFFGGTAASKSVILTLPQNAIVFGATTGYYCHKADECNNGSAQKVFKVGATTLATIPAGTSLNDGTGSISLFTTLPTALGKNDGTISSSSSSSAVAGVIKANFTLGVSKNELQQRGFITTNNQLRFKLVHIPSGVGHATISLTCGASCDE